MERGSLDKLKFDKRLRRRDGWSGEEETQSYIDSLPDVSDKIALESDEPESQADSEAAEESTQAAEHPQAAQAVALDANPEATPGDGSGDEAGGSLSPPSFKEV
ncbi:MAG: hypothetical protein JRG89_10510 [Deltaproteobacteria bacterium]|nr:hypothetical protein [Deltaproteobacteria bacterium]MBW2388856.1 hypothetical protein [Deltaproteobacteria bacterium]